MIRVMTEYPVARDSNDQIMPEGARKDNTTNLEVIEALEEMFGKGLSLLDLGCAGGRFVYDLCVRGNKAVGLEGSDYPSKARRALWVANEGRCLFTCDVSRPFTILGNELPAHFQVVTAWEFFEHIPEERLSTVFDNILRHTVSGSLLLATINNEPSFHHVNCKEPEWWKNRLNLISDELRPEVFPHKLRDDKGSFFYVGRIR